MKQKCSDDNDDDDENLMLVKRGKGKKKESHSLHLGLSVFNTSFNYRTEMLFMYASIANFR